MAPLLIDQRSLLKIGIVTALVAALLFVSGFTAGFQRAVSVGLKASETTLLALPEKTLYIITDVEPQKPAVIAAGEDIDVDLPLKRQETLLNASVDADDFIVAKKTLHSRPVKAPLTGMAAVIAQQASAGISLADSQTPTLATREDGNAFKGDAVSENEQALATEKQDYSRAGSAPNLPLAGLPGADYEQLKAIKYTIQAGIFGRLANAKSMMAALREKGLDAYILAHANKKNTMLYKVRFGYFADRKAAAIVLQDYKNSKNGDAYLVEFSAYGSSVNASSENIKQMRITDGTDNGSSEPVLSATILPLSAWPGLTEKSTRLEITQAPATMTNKQMDSVLD